MCSHLEICWWNWSGCNLAYRRRDVVFSSTSLFVEEWSNRSCICHPISRDENPSREHPTEVSNIRASGSYIRGTNGWSNGLVPMLRNFNETARYVDQGRGFVNSMLYYMNMYCHIIIIIDHHHLWMSLGPAFRPTICFYLPPKMPESPVTGNCVFIPTC